AQALRMWSGAGCWPCGGQGLNSLDRCTYAAGISVRVSPPAAAVVAGSGRHSFSRATGVRRRDETRRCRQFAGLCDPLRPYVTMSAMTAVFVHGVPEPPAVWDGLLAALDRPDAVALSLPGFDGARPAGFEATMEEYAGWLAAQLERLGDPVDLVGHDWGGGFVVRVVSTRPELVRSWVTDAAGLGDAEFEWHDF